MSSSVSLEAMFVWRLFANGKLTVASINKVAHMCATGKCMYVLHILQANLGRMDLASEQWKMICGNMALVQVSIANCLHSNARNLWSFILPVCVLYSIVMTGSEGWRLTGGGLVGVEPYYYYYYYY